MVTQTVLAALLVLAQAADPTAPPSLDAPAAQAPAADAPAATPATADSGSNDNAPPPLFDPVADAAAADRDVLIRRVVTWTGAGLAGVGAGILALGWTALLGGVMAGLWAQDRDATQVRLAGTVAIGLGSVVLLLGLPLAALGSAWFATAFVALLP